MIVNINTNDEKVDIGFVGDKDNNVTDGDIFKTIGALERAKRHLLEKLGEND